VNQATDSAHQPSGAPAAACGECAAPMAGDQRFCLECGAPAGAGATLSFAPIAGSAAAPSPVPPASPPAHLLAGRHAGAQAGSHHSSAPTVIAAAGVLLLAMGVGVLIGRTGAGTASSTPSTPQVITVSAPATSTTSTESSESTSSAQAKSSGKHAKKSSESGNGVGSSLEHPAPPSVLNNLKKSGGGSYEQKSKNLPNVISTG
jgi:hypothetical protein